MESPPAMYAILSAVYHPHSDTDVIQCFLDS